MSPLCCAAWAARRVARGGRARARSRARWAGPNPNPIQGPFYQLDGAPPAVAARRTGAMAALRARVAVRWPRASELCSAL